MAPLPVVIQKFMSDEQSATFLSRIELDKPPYNEAWLQNLIHENPELVPAGEIDAAFEDIIPVVRELALPSGFLDNLYFTPSGYPVLVEVKLWKNQEARRKVIAQIVEYAKDFSQMTYETLNAELRKLRKNEQWGNNPLYEIISRETPAAHEEATFVDRVVRNMREGRFLLLVLGDGVREGMADLANYLMYHSLRYEFGIVQIRLLTLPDGSVLALPDTLAKAQMIERHVTVVNVADASMHITEGDRSGSLSRVVGERLEKTSLSLEDFFDTMSETSPDNVLWLKGFLEAVSDLPLELRVGKNGDTLMLKSLTGITLMYINPPFVAFWGVAERFKKSPSAMKSSKEILERFAGIVGGAVKVFPSGGLDVRVNDKAVSISALQGQEQALKDALRYAVQELDLLQATD